MENSKYVLYESLAHDFANNKNKWKKMTIVYATEFLAAYYENLSFMKKRFATIEEKRRLSISSTRDEVDASLINNYAFLESCLKISDDNRGVNVNLQKIQKNYVEVESVAKIKEIEESLIQMENDWNLHPEFGRERTFYELNNSYNAIIGYVKFSKNRENFFYKHLLKERTDKVVIIPQSFNPEIYSIAKIL